MEWGTERHWVRMKHPHWEVILFSQWGRICLGSTGYRGVHLDRLIPNSVYNISLFLCMQDRESFPFREIFLYHYNFPSRNRSSQATIQTIKQWNFHPNYPWQTIKSITVYRTYSCATCFSVLWGIITNISGLLPEETNWTGIWFHRVGSF